MTKETAETDAALQNIWEKLGEDPVVRGINVLREKIPDDFRNAVEAVAEADEVYLVTGFFIPTAGQIETDGLSGASFLAKALLKLGKRVTFLEDQHNENILKAGFAAIGISPDFIKPDLNQDPANWIQPKGKSVIVAVERPGRGEGGFRRTMRGIKIPADPLDEIFAAASNMSPRPTTVSCADGLNEVGMGKLAKGIIPKDSLIQSEIPVDYLVIAGVADWSAFGIIAGLELESDQDLLPTVEDQATFLNAIVRAGAVDGITGKNEPTIDSLPLAEHQKMVQSLRQRV
jgi:D-glutamate cyclase